VPSEQLRFWLESVGSVAGILALAAIALELQRARKADAREFLARAHEKFISLYPQYLRLSTIEVTTTDEMLLVEDEEGAKAYSEMVNFWDSISTEIRHNPSERKMAVEAFGRAFYGFYEKWSPFLKGIAEIEGEGSYGGAAHLEWFADEYFKHLPGDWAASQRLDTYVEKLKAEAS